MVLNLLISTLFADPLSILLSGVFVGFLAKIFHKKFIMGFIAGALPRIVVPFALNFLPFSFPFAPVVLLTLLYFLFIWILCRFKMMQGLIFAIITVFVMEFGIVFLKQFLHF